MQPPYDKSPFPLPEILSDGTNLCHISKRYKYITISIRHRDHLEDGTAITFTLHQTEAKKLGEALCEAATRPIDLSFADEWTGTIEGVYVGGPPRKEHLKEFNGGSDS